jgi:hypothetical protein
MERRGAPAANQADHLLRPHPYSLMSLAQPFTHLWSGCQDTQERQGPTLLGPGKCDHHCHHDPAQAGTAHGLFAAGARTITVMASLADLAAPASFQRFIDHQIHAGSGWHKGRDNEKQELAAHRYWRPAGSVEHLMEVAPVTRHAVIGVAQGRSDCSASLSQQRTGEQDHQVSPGGSRKQGAKSHQNLYNGIGKGHMLSPK